MVRIFKSKHTSKLLVLFIFTIFVSPTVMVFATQLQEHANSIRSKSTPAWGGNDAIEKVSSTVPDSAPPPIVKGSSEVSGFNQTIYEPPQSVINVDEDVAGLVAQEYVRQYSLVLQKRNSESYNAWRSSSMGEPVLEYTLTFDSNKLAYEVTPLSWIVQFKDDKNGVGLVGVSPVNGAFMWSANYEASFPQLSTRDAKNILESKVPSAENATAFADPKLVFVNYESYWMFDSDQMLDTNDFFVRIPDGLTRNWGEIQPELDLTFRVEQNCTLLGNSGVDAVHEASFYYSGQSETDQLPSTTPANVLGYPASYSYMIGKVPYFYQDGYQWCAVYSLKESFWWWGTIFNGHLVTEQDIAAYFGLDPNPPSSGLSLSQIDQAFVHFMGNDNPSSLDHSYGISSIDIAKSWIYNDSPEIAAIRAPGTGNGWANHAVSLIGWDDNLGGGSWYLHDTAPFFTSPANPFPNGYDVVVSYNTFDTYWNVFTLGALNHGASSAHPGDGRYVGASVQPTDLPGTVEYGQTYTIRLALTNTGNDVGSSRYSWSQGVFLRLFGAELTSADAGGFKSFQAYDEARNSVPIQGAKIIEFYSDFTLSPGSTIYAYATIKALSNVEARYRGWIMDEDNIVHCTVHTQTIDDSRPTNLVMPSPEAYINRDPSDSLNDRTNFLDYPTYSIFAAMPGLAPSSVSVDVNPNTITYGSGTTISGQISSMTPGDLSGTVYLQYSTDGSSWNSIGSTPSSSSGFYSYWWTPSSTGTFYVRAYWNGNSHYSGATSSSVVLTVSSPGGNLADHTMCKGVQSSDPWDPITRTSTFFTDDPAAYSWLKFVDIYDGPHYVHWDWYDPDGQHWTWDTTIPAPPPDQYWIWYKVNSYLGPLHFADSKLGRTFTTRVYYDSNLVVTETWTVVKHQSSITASLSSNSITYGQTVTLNSQLSPSLSSGTTTLQYSIDNVNWNNFASGAPSNGYYSNTWTPPNTGTYYMRAIWSGNLDYYSSTSSTQGLTVNRASTSLTTSLSSPTITYGSAVTITASMSPTLQGKSVIIQYSLDGSTWLYLGSGTTSAAGQYSCPWTPDAGVYYLRSTWSGDANYNGATSPSQQLTVNKASTSTVCSLSTGSIDYGESVTITGTVSVSVSDGTMTLEYSTDGMNWNLISSSTPSSGTYSYAWTPTSCGIFSIRATWSGSNNYQGSTSSTQTLTVNRASTTLAMSLSSATIPCESSVTVTASMSPQLQGKSVTFEYSLDDSSWQFLDSETTDSTGQCAYVWTPAFGTYYLRSTWTGDNNYKGATSSSEMLSVVDIVPPSTPSPDDGVTGPSDDNTPTFTWPPSSDMHSGVKGYWWKVNGGSETWTASTSVTLPAQSDGSHIFYVRAEDNAENKGDYGQHDFQIETLAVRHFDFGTSSSPVEPGYVQVTEATAYSGSLGYGWSATSGLSSRDRGAPDNLRRDLVFSSADHTFNVDLANGLYNVTLVIGDKSFMHDLIDVYAEGVLEVDHLTVNAGTFSMQVLTVAVGDGQLNIRFHDGGGSDLNWVINVIKIEPFVPIAPWFDFGTVSSPVQYGYVQVIESTAYSGALGYGWDSTAGLGSRGRGAPDNLRRDLVFSSADHTFNVDLANGLYRVTLVIGDKSFMHDLIDVYAEGVLEVDHLTVNAGTFSMQVLTVAVGDGQLNIRFHDGGGSDANWVINSIKIEPGAPTKQFDFGTVSSPVQYGYVQVTESTVYSAGTGYGWDTTVGLGSRDRGAPDNLRRDLVFSSAERTFSVGLANGQYTVTLIIGDNSFTHDLIDVYAEGVLEVDHLTVNAGAFSRQSFTVTVNDNLLSIRFHDGGGSDANWVINSIRIQPVT